MKEALPLPRWLNLVAEIRGRTEARSGLDFTRGADDNFYLHRLRVWADIAPVEWVSFHFQGQDSRVLGESLVEPDGLANTFDLRQGYVDLGGRRKWHVRLGRQELAFGDERLVGSDNFWCNLGITHDALRISYASERWQLDGFASTVVEPAYREFDRFRTDDRLMGLYFSFGDENGFWFQPYWLWSRNTRPLGVEGPDGRFDVYTWGVQSTGALAYRLDYNTEMVFQNGSAGPDGIRAWAGAWELGHTLGSDDRSPRVAAGYTYASGDSSPGDRRWGTFDDLVPAGYNDAGIVDPFAWRNLRDLSGSFEWQFATRWHALADFHGYWLANRDDGLYPDSGGPYLVRNSGASSSHIGNQLNLMVTYAFSRHFQLYAGYGHLFAGRYMKESELAGGRSPHLTWRYIF